jgi:hypothetical protein
MIPVKKNYLFYFLAMAMLAGSLAAADEHDLSAAALLVHFPPDFSYSTNEDWSARYDSDFRFDNPIDNNPSIPDGVYTSLENPAVWYVIVAPAFCEERTWAGVRFGFGDYNADAFEFIHSNICLPDGLVIPTATWPGPNEGVALTATTTNWQGDFEAVYYFIGYQYTGTALISISGYDDGTYHEVQLGTATAPSIVYEITSPAMLGTMGIGVQGYAAEIHCHDFYVCCAHQECLITSESNCDAISGVFYADEYDCVGAPCGACCIQAPELVCIMTTRSECEEHTGYAGYWHTDVISCPAEEGLHVCFTLPVEAPSWGAIKTLYHAGTR